MHSNHYKLVGRLELATFPHFSVSLKPTSAITLAFIPWTFASKLSVLWGWRSFAKLLVLWVLWLNLEQRFIQEHAHESWSRTPVLPVSAAGRLWGSDPMAGCKEQALGTILTGGTVLLCTVHTSLGSVSKTYPNSTNKSSFLKFIMLINIKKFKKKSLTFSYAY